MRERITFVQKLGDSLEPSELKVDSTTVSGPEVHAVREERLKFSVDELPSELQTLLSDFQGLDIKWVTDAYHETVSPLLSRLPPGFHVVFTPRRPDTSLDSLCSALVELFGDDIYCSNESFTALSKAQSTGVTTLQYYQPLRSLSHLTRRARSLLCRSDDTSCSNRLDSLTSASSLDIAYDSDANDFRVTATWPYQRQHIHATSREGHRTEVGILSTDKPKTLDPHEIGISGLITVLRENKKLSPVLFSFAARHRDAESSFSARFLSPTGLHPTLQLRLSSARPPRSPEEQECSLHAYLTLPRTIFPDRYQLSDPIFLASKNLSALRFATKPVDLEAPDYAVPQWGLALLLDLATPTESAAAGEFTAEIPLHLRYLAPASGGYRSIEIPYPAVFWACRDPAVADAPLGPFERSGLGYDALFADKPGIVFWHVEPKPAAGQGSRMVNTVRVPVLDMDKAGWVNLGTAAVIVFGFAWVVGRLAGVWLRRVAAEKERKKKTQ